ncbi:unnamed protein product [Sphagnum troendelagicum]
MFDPLSPKAESSRAIAGGVVRRGDGGRGGSDGATSDWGKDRESEKASRAREQRQRRLRTTTSDDARRRIVRRRGPRDHSRPDPGAVRS